MPRTFLSLTALFVFIAGAADGQEGRLKTSEVVAVSFTDVANERVASENAQVSRSEIEKEQAAVQSAGLSETQKPECEARLVKAIGWLQASDEDNKRLSAFEAQLKSIPDSVVSLKEALAHPRPQPEVKLPGDATVVQLESRLTEIRQKAEALEADLAAKKKDAESRAPRVQEISKELLELQKRVTQTEEQLTPTPPPDFEGRSKWFEQAARLTALLQQTGRLRAERRYLEAATEVLPLKREQLEREWKTQQKTLAAWQKAVESWRKQESKRQAESARRSAENSHPALRALAEQNVAIAEKRAITANGIEKIGKTIARLKETSKTLETDFEDLRQKVAYAGTTSSTGVLLRKQRDELPPSVDFAVRDRLVEVEMPKAHLQLMDWKKLQRDVSDPSEAAERMLGQLDALTERYGRDQVVQVVTSLLAARHDLLDKAIPDQETYLQELNKLDLSNQALGAEVEDFRDYLDERVLWMRSDELLSADDLSQAARGTVALVSIPRWREVARVGFGDIVQTPAIGLGVLALFVLIIVFRARMLNLQARLSQPPPEGKPASFAKYAAAFAITLLIAVRWPIVFFAIGSRLKLAAGSTGWTQAVGTTFLTTVIFVWGCEVMREVVRPNGIGEKLFRWSLTATKSMRSTLKLTLLCGTPLIALLQLSQFEELAELESLHRVLFIGTILLFVFQIGIFLRPNGRLMRSLAEQAPSAAVFRLRHMIWASMTAAPAGFAMLSILGFHYSAYRLSGRLAETGSAIIVMIFIYALALCWLAVNGYNRALRERSESNPEQQSPSLDLTSPLSGATISIQREPIESISLHDAADHEFRHLLRYAAIGTLIFGGWFIWADVLPALHVLDQVELWQNFESVAESVTDAEGKESIVMIDRAVPTTLTDLLKAILVCIGTVMIGRKLPGFLELTVLDRLPIDQGGRQAIAILIRYAATLVGVLVACQVIRLSWGSVQWLAAAMTVGLGFGLQEIFANLVSGIILLFERPIRMGDLVTVSDVTGTVTRMQIRATTITDFDRRELIVPNKKFITDNVINWTLSDPISRVVLPVGVAYGTNIARVESILLRIANNCSFVMREPGPTTLFKQFGDSTLDIELRVFLPTRDFYVEVVNELNRAIAAEFEKAEIEIAFPQRDLHIKSVESIQAVLPNEGGREAA